MFLLVCSEYLINGVEWCDSHVKVGADDGRFHFFTNNVLLKYFMPVITFNDLMSISCGTLSEKERGYGDDK